MVTSRAEAHSLRLALTYALMDRSDRIEPEHLEAALAVWDYAERSARHIFGDSTGDRDADRILEALRATPEGLTRSEIRLQVFGNNKTAKTIAAALGLLLRLGRVHRQPVDTGGRRAERWFADSDSDSKNSKNSKTPSPAPDLSSFSSFSSRVPGPENSLADPEPDSSDSDSKNSKSPNRPKSPTPPGGLSSFSSNQVPCPENAAPALEPDPWSQEESWTA
jgi:hypothetical protein